MVIFFFLISVALVFNNYDRFGRGVLGYSLLVIGLFWASAMWSVIGIFSRDRSWIVGGKSFTGLVPLFFAIILLLPFFEQDNSWQRQLITQEIPRQVEQRNLKWDQRLHLPADMLENDQAILLAELAGWQLVAEPESGSLSLEPVTEQTDKRDRAEAFDLWMPAVQGY